MPPLKRGDIEQSQSDELKFRFRIHQNRGSKSAERSGFRLLSKTTSSGKETELVGSGEQVSKRIYASNKYHQKIF